MRFATPASFLVNHRDINNGPTPKAFDNVAQGKRRSRATLGAFFSLNLPFHVTPQQSRRAAFLLPRAVLGESP